MDITQLQNFRSLAKTQHMTLSAEQLNLAQSALSRSLRKLEEELGVKLFDRIGKYIYLNDNGQRFLRHVNRILDEYDDALLELQEQQNGKKQTVTLSMHAASKLLPEIIRAFGREHPEISLKITQQDSADEANPASDITIYSAATASNARNAVVLVEEEIYLALPASHPLASRREIALSEAANEPFICLYRGKGLRTITDALCRQAGFSPNIILESDSPSTVRELISVGAGLAFVPMISWYGIGDDPDVSLVKISSPHCKRYILMKWRTDRYLTAAASCLREFLAAYFKEIQAQRQEN